MSLDTPHSLPSLTRSTLARALGLSALCALCACAPLPYTPSVTLQQERIAVQAPSAPMLKTENSSWLGDLGAKLRQAEPRIVFVDGTRLIKGESDFLTLTDVVAEISKSAESPDRPDFLLALSSYSDRVLHENNYYAPLVGYDHILSEARMTALLVRFPEGDTADSLIFQSQYSSVVVQAFYGVMTVPMPKRAIHAALVAELARRLRAARPSGPIRVIVMFER